MNLENLSREELERELRALLDVGGERRARRRRGGGGLIEAVTLRPTLVESGEFKRAPDELVQAVEAEARLGYQFACLDGALFTLTTALARAGLRAEKDFHDAIADHARVLVEADYAALLTPGADTPLAECSTPMAPERSAAIRRDPLTTRALECVTSTGQPVRMCGQGPSYARPSSGDPSWIRSVVGVPIVREGAIALSLVLVNTRAGAEFTEGDQEALSMLAARAAAALEISRLGHELRGEVEARDTLLAVVSHELRSLLQAIQLSASLILQEDGGGQSRKYVGTIQRSASRMRGLAEDLLQVALIRAGKFIVDAHPEAVRPIVEGCVEAMAPVAAAASVKVRAEIEDEVPSVRGDEKRIAQVLTNLVGNAIKFSRPGASVVVRATRCCETVEISVADGGPGIAPDEVPYVFEPFWRAKDQRVRGFGLGLFIAKGIVEALGGRMWVESRRGVGTTFTFTLQVTAD